MSFFRFFIFVPIERPSLSGASFTWSNFENTLAVVESIISSFGRLGRSLLAQSIVPRHVSDYCSIILDVNLPKGVIASKI